MPYPDVYSARDIDSADVVMLAAIPQVDYPLYVADRPVSVEDYYDLLDAMPEQVRRLRMLHAGSLLILPPAQAEALVAANLARQHGTGYRLIGTDLVLRRHDPAPPDTTLWTLTVDATAGAVQSIATEALGYQPGVTQGAFTTVAVAGQATASKLATALRAAGYQTVVSKGWGA